MESFGNLLFLKFWKMTTKYINMKMMIIVNSFHKNNSNNYPNVYIKYHKDGL